MEVRRFIRRAIHLPKDTPVADFHSLLCDDGLGVPSFLTKIPVPRRGLEERLVRSLDQRVAKAEAAQIPANAIPSKDLKRSAAVR